MIITIQPNHLSGGSHMPKRKTLPRDFDQLVKNGNEAEIKEVFEKCDINAYGGYNRGNALEGR